MNNYPAVGVLETIEVLRALRVQRDKCKQRADKRDQQGYPIDATSWRDNAHGINRAILTINKLAGYTL